MGPPDGVSMGRWVEDGGVWRSQRKTGSAMPSMWRLKRCACGFFRAPWNAGSPLFSTWCDARNGAGSVRNECGRWRCWMGKEREVVETRSVVMDRKAAACAGSGSDTVVGLDAARPCGK